MTSRISPLVLLFLCLSSLAQAQSYEQQYSRPVDVAPTEEDIGEGYVVPPVQRPLPRSFWMEALDVGLLVVALSLSVWIVLTRRNRSWLVVLTIGCLAYFGFYRDGCVCPIGAIQNVTVSFIDPSYAVSYSVIAFFMLPLILALFFGRVFCGGVCPLGAIQELVVLKPVQVPRPVDRVLGSIKWTYLTVAILFAMLPAVSREFLICRWDPFVGFFRGDGPAHMLMIGGGLLVVGMFVGRPFCRYLCPYGALLSLTSRLSWTGVTITPDNELDCGLCSEACPYGAIENMRAVRSACLFCARCYSACPRHLADHTPVSISDSPEKAQ
jgi:NosR/NirI family nitrous oxide reductase transcriptional regulator